MTIEKHWNIECNNNKHNTRTMKIRAARPHMVCNQVIHLLDYHETIRMTQAFQSGIYHSQNLTFQLHKHINDKKARSAVAMISILKAVPARQWL